jgi:hypothetical protein
MSIRQFPYLGIRPFFGRLFDPVVSIQNLADHCVLFITATLITSATLYNVGIVGERDKKPGMTEEGMNNNKDKE